MRRLAVAASTLVLAVAACGENRKVVYSEVPADGRLPQTFRDRSDQCADVEAPRRKPAGGQNPPERRIDPDRRYEIILETSCGRISIQLQQRLSPNAAASFANLVEARFYDHTVFHRIVPSFVVQGGDPTGTGTGGPGYSTRDVPPKGTSYRRGTVAMGKIESDPRGSAASQFFIVTAADPGLEPDYAPIGRVLKGMAVVEAIDGLGDPTTGDRGIPMRPVVLKRATLIKR